MLSAKAAYKQPHLLSAVYLCVCEIVQFFLLVKPIVNLAHAKIIEQCSRVLQRERGFYIH